MFMTVFYLNNKSGKTEYQRGYVDTLVALLRKQ